MQPIFHIAEREAWEKSLALGRYEAESLATEGFMHASTQAQLLETAKRYYRGRAGLCLFVIDPLQLGAALKYEAPIGPGGARAGEGLFPHLYGPLKLNALLRVLPFEPQPDGSFQLQDWREPEREGEARKPLDNLLDEDPRAQRYWAEFCHARGVPQQTPHQAYYLGNSAELAHELLDLIVRGEKRAATTLLWSVERYPALAPVADGYAVLTEFDGTPRAVIRTCSIEVCAFDEVGAEYAREEGEGDGSLASWRADHWAFYSAECALLGCTPRPDMRVIKERFELLYT